MYKVTSFGFWEVTYILKIGNMIYDMFLIPCCYTSNNHLSDVTFNKAFSSKYGNGPVTLSKAIKRKVANLDVRITK